VKGFLKNRHCPRAEPGELPRKTQAFDTVAEKISFNDVSIILFTDEKTFTVTTETTSKKPKNDRLYANSSIKKKNVVTTPAHRIIVQSLMASVDE